MACCEDEQSCPMHRGHPDASGLQPTLTQAQADSCCAASEQEQSGRSQQISAPSITGLSGPGVMVPPAPPRLVLTDAWRAAVPDSSPPLRKHILLAVFLI